MRKSLFLFLAIGLSLIFGSQNSYAYSWDYDNEIDHSGFFTDISAGLVTGDMDSDLGVGLKVGYRWNFYQGLSWDTASIGVNAGVSDFTSTMNLRFLTGLRYNTPVNDRGKSFYVNAGVGYCFSTDETDFGGVAYEVGAGINLSKLVSLGLVWEGSKWSYDFSAGYYDFSISSHFGTIALKLGLNF